MKDVIIYYIIYVMPSPIFQMIKKNIITIVGDIPEQQWTEAVDDFANYSQRLVNKMNSILNGLF